MATPMQYRLVSDILAFENVPGFRSHDLWRQKSVTEIANAVRSGCPIIDYTDCMQVVMDELPNGKVKLSRERIAPLIQPYKDSGIIPMAWPRAVMTCADHRACAATLFMVQQSMDRPGYAFWPYAVFADGPETGVVPMLKAMSHDDWMTNPEINGIMVALALASAKNAAWVESSANRSMRKHYPSVAGIRFRHIEIDMGKPKRRADSREDVESAGVPWHHRRGHWAYYSPDKPLFGRAGSHGWYWRPYMEVGDKAHGEIVQDYTVRGTLPECSA